MTVSIVAVVTLVRTVVVIVVVVVVVVVPMVVPAVGGVVVVAVEVVDVVLVVWTGGEEMAIVGRGVRGGCCGGAMVLVLMVLRLKEEKILRGSGIWDLERGC